MLTWFGIAGLHGAAATNRGTQAGTPAADLIFAVAIGRVLKKGAIDSEGSEST